MHLNNARNKRFSLHVYLQCNLIRNKKVSLHSCLSVKPAFELCKKLIACALDPRLPFHLSCKSWYFQLNFFRHFYFFGEIWIAIPARHSCLSCLAAKLFFNRFVGFCKAKMPQKDFVRRLFAYLRHMQQICKLNWAFLTWLF